MNVYLVSIKRKSWCKDYAMIVVAEDEKHAEEATQRIKEYQRQQIETKYYTYDDAYKRGFMEGYQKGYRDGFKDGKE